MSSTPSLEIPDLTHALLWREAAVESNRAATRDHELAREGLVEALRDEAVWRSFAMHYRAERSLETNTAMLEALSGVDLLTRYQSEPIESRDAVLHRAEQLKPIQLRNEVNPLAHQQVGIETRDQYELSEERSFRDHQYQLSDASAIRGPHQGQDDSPREKQRFSIATFVKNLFGRKQSESENSRLDELQGSRIASDPDRSDKFFDDSLAKMHAERKAGFDAKVDEYVEFLIQRADEEKVPVTYAKKMAAANVDFVFGTIPKEELGESVTKDLRFTHSKIDLSGNVETLTNGDLQKLPERSIESGRIESKLDLNRRETWQDASFLGSYARLHAPNWAVFVNSLPFDWSREKPNPEHLREQLLPHHEKAEAILQADRQRNEELHRQAGWSGDPKDYESWNRAELDLFKASAGLEESHDIPAVEEIDWTKFQTEPDEEREALYDYLIDGVDGYLSHYRYTDDEPSNRELREAKKYADAVVARLQQENPGASYGELLNKLQAQDRAEFHPSWDKPVIGPAEENAKAELLGLLADEHISPWSLDHDAETSNELFERAERKAGEDLDRMVKANPNASYVELLAQKTVEEKRSVGQVRDFENSELKADYNSVAGTVDTLDKQNNTRIHIIVPETGVEPTQEQIETRLEEAREQIEGEQEGVLEQKADQRSEQKALEDDQNKESTTKGDEIRLSEIEAELIGTQFLGKDYGKYNNHRADSQSGVYNGPITAETDHHLVQQISARSNVIHEKQRLSFIPELGESVAVSYNRGVANVLQQRDPAHDLSRAIGLAR